jgi:integrase
LATIRLNTAAVRAKLPRNKYHFDTLAPGIALAYRRGPKAGKDGVWAVRFPAAAGGGSRYTLSNIALADDLTEADSVRWLTYREAVEAALAKARKEETAADAPLTVREACRVYIERRTARGTGRPKEVATALRKYLGRLADERVACLDHGTLQAWAHKAPRHATTAVRAALNLTPVNVRPSSVVLSALREHRAQTSRGLVEAVMGDREVSAAISKARRHDPQFGLFVAVLGATGCRPSQVARCRVGDLLVKDHVMVVPPSKKGKDANKAKPSSRMPLDPGLVRELQAWAAGRPADALLFHLPRHVRGGGLDWHVDGERGWLKRDWGDTARAAGIGRRLYDLRHAAIVRMLLAGVPIRLVAAKLDTSSKIIETVYSRWIEDPNDALVRAALTPKRLTVVA